MSSTLDELADRVHDYVVDHPGSRRSEIAHELGEDIDRVGRALYLLYARDLIACEGRARASRWTSLDEIRARPLIEPTRRVPGRYNSVWDMADRIAQEAADRG